MKMPLSLTKARFYYALILLPFGAVAMADTAPQATTGQDLRLITTGMKIASKTYSDQPYIVINKDGHWICTLTTGSGHEGSGGQHIISTISKNQGKTWSTPVAIEPPTGPVASWVTPLLTPSGRLYAFYTYNGDEINTLPGSKKKIRNDMLGWYCFKYSDDNGMTWSKRYRIPVRTTAADRANQWKGKVMVFWGIDKPKVYADGVRFFFTKLGKYMLDNGEGWMLYSDNILTETNPEKINWELLPDGEHGVRHKDFGSVQEEQNHVEIDGKNLYMVYRTTKGYPAHTYSNDGGHTWDTPVYMTYSPDGRKIKNPRACPKVWRCKNGKYLFWFHNHSGQGFPDRNPAWLVGGIVRDGKMHWSEPEIALYSYDLSYNTGRMSYPDLIEQDGKYWISETQKTIARIHPVDPSLLEGMWAQLEGKGEVTQKGLALDLQGAAATAKEAKMPTMPNLGNTNTGFSIDLKFELKDLEPGQVILDSRDDAGKGVAVSLEKGGSLKLQFSDGKNKPGVWTTDPGLLQAGKTHHVTAVVDGGPNIIIFVVDGKLCNGGDARQYGWGRFASKLGDINGAKSLKLSPSFNGKIHGLRIYDRYLRTSEAVANYQAGSK